MRGEGGREGGRGGTEGGRREGGKGGRRERREGGRGGREGRREKQKCGCVPIQKYRNWTYNPSKVRT